MRAYGNWVVMAHVEETTESGIVTNQGAAMKVISSVRNVLKNSNLNR